MPFERIKFYQTGSFAAGNRLLPAELSSARASLSLAARPARAGPHYDAPVAVSSGAVHPVPCQGSVERAVSSAGRALRLQRRGHWFEPSTAHEPPRRPVRKKRAPGRLVPFLGGTHQPPRPCLLVMPPWGSAPRVMAG